MGFVQHGRRCTVISVSLSRRAAQASSLGFQSLVTVVTASLSSEGAQEVSSNGEHAESR